MEKKYDLIEFSVQYSEAFKELNLEWIEEYFEPEKIDLELLADPQKYFIDAGGAILLVKTDDLIIGCCGLLKHSDKTYEISKMSVTPSFQGLGLGRAMLIEIVKIAKGLGAERIGIISNTILASAIGLYKSIGFVEIPLTSDAYARGNISLLLEL